MDSATTCAKDVSPERVIVAVPVFPSSIVRSAKENVVLVRKSSFEMVIPAELVAIDVFAVVDEILAKNVSSLSTSESFIVGIVTVLVVSPTPKIRF